MAIPFRQAASLPVGFLALAAALSAATIVPPRDLGELALGARAVVLARAGGSAPFARGPLVFTATGFTVEDGLSGPLARGDLFTVEAPGGEMEGRGWLVPGSPRFTAGEAYLLFLARKPPSEDGASGAWIPAVLAHGILREVAGAGGVPLLVPIAGGAGAEGDGGGAQLARPDGAAVEELGPYVKDEIIDRLVRVLSRREAWDGASARAPAEWLPAPEQGAGGGAPSQCSFLGEGNRAIRWRAFDTGGTATMFADSTGDLSLAGGGFDLVQEAMGLWMGIPGTSVNLLYGGPVDVNVNCADGAVANAILFNDPCSDMADLNNCSGVLAFGGPLTSGSHSFDGATWSTATGWIVVVNNGSGCLGAGNYRVMLAHELGHGLGYGHVNDGGAMMFANCCHNPNPTDQLCARYTYPAIDLANQRPSVDAGGDVQLALGGNSLRFAGTATDDGLPAAPGRLQTEWRQVGGPAAAAIADPRALATSVQFPRSGTYFLRFDATDGQLHAAEVIQASVQVRAGTSAVLSFRQGEAGYAGTVDTYLQEAEPAADNSRELELSADSDDPRGSGQSSQILLRFADLFGSESSRIPPGARILSAFLEVAVTNDGNGARLHRMTEPWEEAAGWSVFGGDGVQAGREARAAADAAATGTAALERLDVTASLAAWSEDPCSNFGWVFLPAGTDGWDFRSSENTTAPPRLTVEFSLAGGEPLVGAGDSWRYWKGTAEPPAGWREAGFDDSGWLEGAAGFGYADGDDATELTDMRDAYLAVFLRREFDAGDLGSGGAWRLTLIHDDGAVAYLNGTEVGRANLPAGDVDRQTAAPSSIEAQATSFIVPRSLIRSGTNVLAASIHNADLDSSDLSFTALLLPVAGAAAAVDCNALFQRGDVTADGSLNIADPIALLGHLFLGAAAPACLDAGDADDGGTLVIGDAILLLNFLFVSGSPPAPPGVDCGRDPNPDPLGDCATGACGA